MLAHNHIGYTYTQRHASSGSSFPVENSMIYVSGQPRPMLEDGSDCILSLFNIADLEYKPSDKKTVRKRVQFSCFFYALSTFDAILQTKSIYSYPNKAESFDDSQTRRSQINEIVSSGDYLLRGDYYSLNAETWRIENFKDTRKFYTFDESISATNIQTNRKDNFRNDEMAIIKEHILNADETLLININKVYPRWIFESFTDINDIISFLIKKPNLCDKVFTEDLISSLGPFMHDISVNSFSHLLDTFNKFSGRHHFHLITDKLDEHVLKKIFTKEYLRYLFEDQKNYRLICYLSNKHPIICEIIQNELGYSDYKNYNGIYELCKLINIEYENVEHFFSHGQNIKSLIDPIHVNLFFKKIEDFMAFSINSRSSAENIIRQHGDLIIKSEEDFLKLATLNEELANLYSKHYNSNSFNKKLKM